MMMTDMDLIRKELEDRGYVYNRDFCFEDLKELAGEVIECMHIYKDRYKAIEQTVRNWERRRAVR